MSWVADVEGGVRKFIAHCAACGRFWADGNLLYLDVESLAMPWYLLFEQPDVLGKVSCVDEGGFFVVQFTSVLITKVDDVLDTMPSLIEQLQQDDQEIRQRNFAVLGTPFVVDSLIASFDKSRETAAEDPQMAMRCIDYIKQLQQLNLVMDDALRCRVAHFIMGCVRLITLSIGSTRLRAELCVEIGEIIPNFVAPFVVSGDVMMQVWVTRAELEYLVATRDIAVEAKSDSATDFAILANEQLVFVLSRFKQFTDEISPLFCELTCQLFEAEQYYVKDNLIELYAAIVTSLTLLLRVNLDDSYQYLDLDLKRLLNGVRNLIEQIGTELSSSYHSKIPFVYVLLQRVLRRFSNMPSVSAVMPYIKVTLPNMLLAWYTASEQSANDLAGLAQLLRQVLASETGSDLTIDMPMQRSASYYKNANWLHVLLRAKRIEIMRDGLAILAKQDLVDRFLGATCTIDDDDAPLTIVDFIQDLIKRHDVSLFCKSLAVLLEHLLPLKRHWFVIIELIKGVELPEFKAYVITELYARAVEQKSFSLLECMAAHCELGEEKLAALCVLALKESLADKARCFFNKLNPILTLDDDNKRFVPQELASYMSEEYEGDWPFKHFIEKKTGQVITEKQLLRLLPIEQLIGNGYEITVSADRRLLEMSRAGKKVTIARLPEELRELTQLNAVSLQLQFNEAYARDFQARYEVALERYYQFEAIKVQLCKLIRMAESLGIRVQTLRTRLEAISAYLFNVTKALYDAVEDTQPLRPIEQGEVDEWQSALFIDHAPDYETINHQVEAAFDKLRRLLIHVESFDHSMTEVQAVMGQLSDGWSLVKSFLLSCLVKVEIALGMRSFSMMNNVTLNQVTTALQAIIEQYHKLCKQKVIVTRRGHVDHRGDFPEFVPNIKGYPSGESILFKEQRINGTSLFANGDAAAANIPEAKSRDINGLCSGWPL